MKRGVRPKLAVSLQIPEKLESAIETAIESRSKIKDLQEEMRELVDAAGNEIERDARLYQIDLIEWQLGRAADLAEERWKYLGQIKTGRPGRKGTEAGRIGHRSFLQDVRVGFRSAAGFAFVRRPVRALRIPRALRQMARLPRLHETLRPAPSRKPATWERPRPLCVGPSTNGDSCRVSRRSCFRPMKILSIRRKTRTRYSRRSASSFGCCRNGCCRSDFDIVRDMPYMNIANREKHSALHGYAPTANVGRQSRATVVIMDEHAAWPYGGFPQHTALSATSKSLIALSSVQGKNNKFADLCLDNVTPKFVMDWREHPFKDERWYKSLPYGYISAGDVGPADRSGDRSQLRRVAARQGVHQPKRRILLHHLEGTDRFYEEHKARRKDWSNRGRAMAFTDPARLGMGPNVRLGPDRRAQMGLLDNGRPPENGLCSIRYSYFAGSRCRRTVPPSSSSSRRSKNGKRPWASEPAMNSSSLIRNIRNARTSKTIPRDLLLNYGESWVAWDTDYNSGLSQIRDWFSLIDQNKPNPFRPKLMGRTTIYFVAPDTEYMCAFNEQEGAYFVTPSQTQWGFKLLREEFSEYHYPPEERFKPAPAQRPKKIKDDVIDTVRGHATHWGAIAKPMSSREKYLRRLQAMLNPPVAEGEEQPQHVPVDSAPDITYGLTEARLRKELRQEGEILPDSPFEDEDYSYENDYSGGW
jgi:hypothetical protein